MFANASQFFTYNGPHAAAKKGKIKNPERDRAPSNSRNPADHRLLPPSFISGISEACRVRLAIMKPKCVGGTKFSIMFNERTTINDHEQPLINAQTHVGVTFRADE